METKKEGAYENIINQFIRPYRCEYDEYSLGPSVFCTEGGLMAQRVDYKLKNARQLTIVTSVYMIQGTQNERKPVVVGLHCNGGCRLEQIPKVDVLLERGFNFISFDFTGSGISDGEYVSLGWNESQDVHVVTRFARAQKWCNQHVYLWGRSMGGASALMAASEDQLIKGVIADSAFSNMRKLAVQLGQKVIRLPQLIISGFIHFVRKSIMKRADFNLKDLDILKRVSKVGCPIYYVCSRQDTYIKCKHTIRMYQATRSTKKIKYVQGDHNEPREDSFYSEMADYLLSLEKQIRPAYSHQNSNSAQITQELLANWSDDESINSDDHQSAEQMKMIEQLTTEDNLKRTNDLLMPDYMKSFVSHNKGNMNKTMRVSQMPIIQTQYIDQRKQIFQPAQQNIHQSPISLKSRARPYTPSRSPNSATPQRSNRPYTPSSATPSIHSQPRSNYGSFQKQVSQYQPIQLRGFQYNESGPMTSPTAKRNSVTMTSQMAHPQLRPLNSMDTSQQVDRIRLYKQ